MRLYEGVSLAFGPTTEGGFYYDFDLPEKISEDDFPKIEAEMKRIIKDKEPFERFVLDREEARKLCDDLDQDLKVEHIETGLADQSSVSFYRQGEFVDLCRGPHIPDAGKIKAIKLMSIAGSHWKEIHQDVSCSVFMELHSSIKNSSKRILNRLKRPSVVIIAFWENNMTVCNQPGCWSGTCLWLPKGARARVALEDFLWGVVVARI